MPTRSTACSTSAGSLIRTRPRPRRLTVKTDWREVIYGALLMLAVVLLAWLVLILGGAQ